MANINPKNFENISELTSSLSSKMDSTVQKILNEWMTENNDSLDNEAARLLAFVQAWYRSRDNDCKDARNIRDSAINSTITKKIENHIRNALQSEERPISDNTFELLKWGLYGSNKGSSKDKEQSTFNEIMQLDFKNIVQNGTVLSANKMEEITPYSRKTIAKYRNKEDFTVSLELQIKALKFILERHGKSP